MFSLHEIVIQVENYLVSYPQEMEESIDPSTHITRNTPKTALIPRIPCNRVADSEQPVFWSLLLRFKSSTSSREYLLCVHVNVKSYLLISGLLLTLM